MIKLERNYTPIKLTPTFVKVKTQEFLATSKNVWNIKWLKESLISLSNNKCCYCECDLSEEAKYMEVEHFEDKDTHKSKVLLWDNLLPSCKRCNGSKKMHDVVSEPIVNPFNESPSDFLYLKLYRYKPKNPKGRTTIDVLDLNNSDRMVKKRYKIGEQLHKTIDVAKERLDLYSTNKTTIRKNKLIAVVEGVLMECQKSSIYSATCSHILHGDDDYIYIKQQMEKLNLWNEELEKLHQDSLELVL